MLSACCSQAKMMTTTCQFLYSQPASMAKVHAGLQGIHDISAAYLHPAGQPAFQYGLMNLSFTVSKVRGR
jgi:hypothetical protein